MNKNALDLQIKSFDQDQGVFVGIATTPAPDRVKDVVEPKGAVFSLPLPLLAHHDHEKVIGTVEQATVTESGIEVVCRVLKDVTQEAKEIWGLIQAKAMKGLSIGFRPLDTPEALPGGGYRFKKFEIVELSVVAVAMNGQASITATKSATNNAPKENSTMNIAEQIRAFEQQKSAALAKMDALITKGLTLQGEDETAYKAAESEVAQIDQHLDRLKAAEARQAQTAAPITAKGLPVNVQVTDNAPKGSDYVKFVKALALSKGNPMQAVEIAKAAGYGNRVENVLKAAVGAGSTTSTGFTNMVEPKLMADEFIELLRPATILGKLSQVRIVPSNIRLPRATTGTTAGWVGEGKGAPVTNAAQDDISIGDHKVGAIAVFTEELLRRSEPAADNMVRDDLLATIANAVDVAFIDQANAGVAGVKPASIANAATTAATTGTNAAAVRADVKAAKKAAITANQSMASAVWIMHPVTALALESMVNATTGLREFPLIDSVNGGYFESLPVVLSTNVPGTDVAGYDVIMAVQGEILVAEGGLAIDASREASLEMSDAPTGDAKTPTAASLVSLWQTGSVAIKAIRNVTWTRRRATAVYRISACKYA